MISDTFKRNLCATVFRFVSALIFAATCNHILANEPESETGPAAVSGNEVKINGTSTRPDAHKLYLKALSLRPEFNVTIDDGFYRHLDGAIEIDPYFAEAHALKAYGLGRSIAYGVQTNGLTFETMERIALQHIDNALASSHELGDVYMAQGFIHWSHQRGFPARQAFTRAIELNPDNTEILRNYAIFLSIIGHNDEAVRLSQRAVRQQPSVAANHRVLSYVFMYSGKFPAALDSINRAISINDTDYEAQLLLGVLNIITGNREQAVIALRKAEEIINGSRPYYEHMAIHIYACSILSQEDKARGLFDRFNSRIEAGEYFSASAQALAYLGLGYNNIAFDVLYRSPNEGIFSLQLIKNNLLNDRVLETSRFAEMRSRIGIIDARRNLDIPPF